MTEERVEHTFTLAQRPHAARVLLETVRGLGTFPRCPPAMAPDPAARRRRPGIPTLVVWGDRNLILPAAHLNAARARLPHVPTYSPDTGHMPQIERAEAFSHLVGHFWRKAGWFPDKGR
ncbi:MAG TPA: hypothetical protein VHH53_12640 [Pseudonocardiaceae bacterium]|nr:hypothetical protein [Pseudonocardiaceae bacterium]